LIQADEEQSALQICALRGWVESRHPTGTEKLQSPLSVFSPPPLWFPKSHWKWEGALLPASTEKGSSEGHRELEAFVACRYHQ